MKLWRSALLFAPILIVSSHCVVVEDDDDDGDSDDGDKPKPTYVGANGVAINEVAIYQGLKRTLMSGGAPGEASVPLIAGRNSVIRVYYATDGGYDGRELVARLEIEGGDPIEMPVTLGAGSTEEDMGSTVNFVVPGDRIGATLNYRVSLLQEGKKGTGNASASWPAEGLDPVAVEEAANKLRIILVPFRYDYDGSGRLPDISPEGVERFRERIKQLYPVSDVDVMVHGEIPWNNYIGPDGTGWENVGFRLYNLRSSEGVSDETYLYGMFNPDPSFNQYCGGGCLLGVTLLNNQPPSTGSVDLRLALGVGFEGYAEDTAAHELGHAHGREHAPCGPGLDPQSIDNQFPHDGGQIGLWGLDTTTLELQAPTRPDIMGYCNAPWISDHNYKALLARGKNVNLPKWHTPTRSRAVLVSIDGLGGATWSGMTELSELVRGTSLPGSYASDDGVERQTTAQYFSWDHLPGGWVLVPVKDVSVRRVTVEIGGKMVTAAR
jgi:hypothetical protein